MSGLDYFQSIILGVLQGVTEFLPVSSSGHLALVQDWMQLEPESPEMLLFDVAVHVGTLVAVAAVFATTFMKFIARLRSELGGGMAGRRTAWRILGLGIVACVPTAVIGLAFKDRFESAFGNPKLIALCLLLTGTLLWTTGRIPRPRRGWRRFGWARALLIGVGQGVAILPGVSRSGTTISLAMLLGIKREWAGEFSFLIAVPAICGAALLTAIKVVKESHAPMDMIFDGPLFAGTLAATISGFIALRCLMAAVRRAKFHYFCYYCWLLGLVVLVSLR